MIRRTVFSVLLAIFVLTFAFPLCLCAEENGSSSLSKEGVVTVLDFDGEMNRGSFLPSGIDGAEAEQTTSCKQYEITNEGYYKFASTGDVSEGSSNHNCYADFVFESGICFDNSDYAVFSFLLGTDNTFTSSSTNAEALALSIIGEKSVTDFRIVQQSGEWVLTDGNDLNPAVLANLGSLSENGYWFDFKIVIEKVEKSDTPAVKLHLYLDGKLAFSGGEEKIDSAYIDRIRLSFPCTHGVDRSGESLCVDNIKVEGVSGSNPNNVYDLACLFKNGAPATLDEISVWESILYSTEDENGKITVHSEISPTVSGSYPSTDAFRAAINSASSASVSLKRDVVYDNESISKSSGATVFTLPSGAYTKNVFLNGCTLAHTPYVINSKGEREVAMGHFFAFSNGTGERTLNLIGGYNATGAPSVFKRTASGNCTFKANGGSNHLNTSINFTSLHLLTEDSTDTAQLADGNLDGACWTFSDCNIDFSLSSTKFTGRSTVLDRLIFNNCKVNFTKSVYITNSRFAFNGCEISLEGAGLNASNSTSAVTVSSSKIKGEGAFVLTTPSVLTLGENVRLSDPLSLGALGAGCYAAANTGEDKDEFPIEVKRISLVANLTLYSNIRYNLYFPVSDIVAVDGVDVSMLDTVLVGGEKRYVYSLDFPAYLASEEKSVTFTVNSLDVSTGETATVSLTKTVSLADYVSKILTNGDNSAEYSSSYTLMSDLIDYVGMSTLYFGGTLSEKFSTLTSNSNYSPSASAQIPTSKTDKSALSAYISGAKLNVEASEVKFIFTVGTATEVKLSYTSANGKRMEQTHTECYSGQELELSVRAYDLTGEIEIRVNGGDIKGTYDLAAYAGEIKEKDANAYLLLVKMYNYAVSARAYKFPQN